MVCQFLGPKLIYSFADWRRTFRWIPLIRDWAIAQIRMMMACLCVYRPWTEQWVDNILWLFLWSAGLAGASNLKVIRTPYHIQLEREWAANGDDKVHWGVRLLCDNRALSLIKEDGGDLHLIDRFIFKSKYRHCTVGNFKYLNDNNFDNLFNVNSKYWF